MKSTDRGSHFALGRPARDICPTAGADPRWVNHPFQRKLKVLTRGVVEVQGRLEGVSSNRLRLKLVVEPDGG